MVKNEFNPFVLKEFYSPCGNSFFYRNLFKPTKYLMLNSKEHKEPKAIFALIRHLVNYDDERFDYVVNWLAYFFQALKKSQVALVLRGDQGAGKGIFVDLVLSPLFGEDYTKLTNSP